VYIYVHQGDVIETNWDDLRVFLALALIRKYEGTLDRFTGDGMLVFFNDPLPCPDAPDRAARLAIEMRDAVAALNPGWRRHGHRMGFGIGMAQGYATLGRIGFEDRFDYTAIGAVVNLAAGWLPRRRAWPRSRTWANASFVAWRGRCRSPTCGS